MKLKVTVNQVPYEVEVEVEEKKAAPLGSIVIGGGGAAPAAPASSGAASASGNAVPAPLAGTVLRIETEEGKDVKSGDLLLVLEAMKMETEITSPRDGKVGKILVKPGDAVQVGQGLVELG
ncbi:MAG: acetyl-CoA carboxylase biotin carboxyl carrier protein subunit [Propionibacteriaceae bacterium]|jgi:methylmalonyl-CoA carboxyltransferase small subunit|nr:acetyl-CoA carboxylase biotin carboxyl carrier protein subunit [Propionibacteriaceae bacterium]